MEQFCDSLIAELGSLITDLGAGGGVSSASVYDTAQVIRLLSLHDQPAIDWLLSEQVTCLRHQ